MPIPTDRGYVVLTRADDGTETLSVCAAMRGGQPTAAFAVHQGRRVVLDEGVRLVEGPTRRFSRNVLEVYVAPDGVLHVAEPHAADTR